jgi:nitroimidazol reductase NimA-like FMN-containing flavoprotein (pyridoxamine 5'-phosphate oxidase superfamily)
MARARIEVRRHPERGRYDRAAVAAVLDAALVAHVAFVDGGQPFCVPMLQARVADAVYVHGSSASRAVRTLGTGVPACLTVTALDGLVLARSAFEHSANYRSAMLLGSFSVVEGDAERLAAFEAFVEKLVPGRWREVRPPDRRELKATTILSLAIGEASAKSRAGPPSDGGSAGAANGTWAGVVPVVTRFGDPQPAPELDGGVPLAASVRMLLARRFDHGGETA